MLFYDRIDLSEGIDIAKSSNIKEFMCFKIVGICKMYVKEINIKIRVDNYYFDKLIKARKLETKNILIYEKNNKNLVIHFTRHVHSGSIKMLSLHYHELI